jgi:hypothetical protein
VNDRNPILVQLSLNGAWLAVVLASSCTRAEPPKLTFAAYGDGYSQKVDFARVEHDFPLSRDDLSKLTPDNIKNYDQEQVDQIYARLTAGAIPAGAYEGGLFFPKGKSGDGRLSEIVGGLKGMAVELKSIKLEMLGATLWKGKVFYPEQHLLRNRIEDLRLLAPVLGGHVDDIAKLEVDGKEQWLLFPAKVYCGQSLLDGRRESIVIDYFYSAELPGYRERPDFLASRNGLQVRDEIRMVRPGFYLGRAYVGKVFLLSFTLFNSDVARANAVAADEGCWSGTQHHVIASKN